MIGVPKGANQTCLEGTWHGFSTDRVGRIIQQNLGPDDPLDRLHDPMYSPPERPASQPESVHSGREEKTVTEPAAGELPYLTTEQMVEVDRAMVEEARIELIQMMENAGRHLAHLARTRFLNGDPREREVVVLAGCGGNGGGVLVCARRLTGWGARIRVYVARPAENFAPVPAHQLDIVRRMGIQVAEADGLPGDGARSSSWMA